MDKILDKLEKLKKLASPGKNKKSSSTKDAAASSAEKMDTSLTDHRHRMTEQEEDEELNDIDNELEEDELITRFDASPWCK